MWVPHPESCVSSDMMGDTEFERLLSLEREDPDLWTRVKKNRDAEVWKRNGEVYTPIHKVRLSLERLLSNFHPVNYSCSLLFCSTNSYRFLVALSFMLLLLSNVFL